jgi:hypothetical protein
LPGTYLLEKNIRRNNLLVASSSWEAYQQKESSSYQEQQEEQGIIAIESLDWTSSADQVQALVAKYPPADLIVLSDLIYAQTRPVWKDLLLVINQLRSSWRSTRRRGPQQEPQHETTTTTTTTAAQPAIMPTMKQQPLERFDGTFSSSCHDDDDDDGDPLVLLGYTQRRRNLDIQGEREFFALLQDMGMEAVMIPMDQVPNSDKRLLTILFELRWKY